MDFGLTLFGVMCVITLILPGLLFKRFYYQGKFSKQFYEGLFTDRLLTYILWGLTIQLITIVSYCWFFEIKAKDIYEEINTFYNNFSNEKIPEFKFSYIRHMLLYLFATTLTALALGLGLHLLVRFLKIDIKTSVFRFSNNWHYYFSGESLDFREFKNALQFQNIKVISTEVDIVVKNDDGRSNMFSGTLTQYSLARNGDLQTIYITQAKRFSKSTPSGYLKPIPGDCFIIPYNNILNINVRYNIAINPNKRIIKIILLGTFTALTILSVFFAIIYPWFVAPTFWKKLISCVVFLISWFNAMGIMLSITANDRKDAPIKNWIGITAALIFVIFLVLLGLVIIGKTNWTDIFETMKLWNHFSN
ncbi:hypothetical protein SMI01S_12150 [Sphingobacterium mizutaii NBRC 14946 = DSM 11724]|uniref:Uncharacterized protein n=2 Tax=Sphingobacterium mizutaii TaxID=1010 RepID=A0AAJ4XCN2_9SPHI|nr:hypothetical protein [Sphingobacterium mizutaii]GEM67609.1 hypothetical protein SMI01S_12150 [Sphingobacterium mizutaii NBRC 14946 = DSM 11724]SDL15225.1 hypothetical protein SAMN05192578_1011549 [Sphingobacterium mizutaii]SNV52338.1 Uncharacterised protein [Sphingobacterium mizutaii]